ncbi:MAG: hypothetical protein KDB29_05440, partial [Planctomycetes bacterium]|nr:hypothetical protein [Planctomycetota bacterium]
MRFLITAFLLLVPTCCVAQGIPREAWSVETSRSPGVRYLFGLETDVIGKDDAVRWQAADGLVSAPILTNPRRSLFLTGSFRYIGLDNQRNTLPPRLIDTSIGAFGNFGVGDLSIVTFFNVSMKSDADAFVWDAFTINASVGVRVPIDDEWSVTPSVFFSTAVRDSGGFSFRYIPLPGVNFAWKPSDKFDLEFGLLSAKLKWKPEDWLTVQAGYTFPYGGSVRVSEQPVSWFRVTQFFGRYSDRYILTGERWPDDHLIKLESFAVGVTHEFFVPLTGEPGGAQLAFGLTYALGLGGKARVWNYVEDDELFELKTNPAHTFALSISLVFGRGG